MSTAFVGKMYLERGGTGSPVAYTRACQVFSLSGLGQTNALVDATTFCSDGDMEYIAGLADGQEVTLECNFVPKADDATRDEMIADVRDRLTVPLRVVIDSNGDGVADETLYFNAVALSWRLNPNVSGRNTIAFTYKMSGAPDWVAGA